MAQRGEHGLEFTAVSSKRVSDEICRQIREMLAAGQLRPGDKLPAERRLAVQLGVGRNAVREALRALESAGVVELSKGVHGGAFISKGHTDRLVAGLRDLLQLEGVTIDQLTEARMWVGEMVTRVACERMTDQDIAILRQNYETAKAAYESGHLDYKLDLNIEFHNILARATKNPVLIFVMHSIMQIMGEFALRHGERINREALDWREKILPLLEKRDVERSVEEMRKYLQRLRKRYLAYMAKPAPVRGSRKKAAAKKTPQRASAVR